MKITNPCPKCERVHERGEYRMFVEGGVKKFGPPDVNCPCGLKLRFSVPFVSVGNGYVLRVLRDSETFR